MKISARNQLKAKVKTVTAGAVNTEVVLVLAGGQEIVANITNGSAKLLGLVEGGDAYAVIKASSVLVAVD